MALSGGPAVAVVQAAEVGQPDDGRVAVLILDLDDRRLAAPLLVRLVE